MHPAILDVRIGRFLVLVAALAIGLAPRAVFAQPATNEHLLRRIAVPEAQLIEHRERKAMHSGAKWSA